MSNVPVVRFNGFDDEWADKKLGDVTKRVKGNDGRMELPTLTISASQGWMDQIDRFSSNIAGNEQKNYTLLKKNDLSYNHGNSKIAKYGVVFSLDSYEEALVPRVYHSFRTTNDSFSLFIEYLFLTKKPDRELRKLVSSGARMDGLLNINYESFMGINIMFPSLPEQKKIGNFFKLLDDTIALHQKELDALKQAKQGFLQKMFPADGEKVPKIRYPEFSDDWVETKLGDIGDTYNGLTGKTKLDFGHGKGKFITYLNVNKNTFSDFNGVGNIEKDIKQNEVVFGDVLFTVSSETPEEVGLSSVWLGKMSNVYLNSFCFGYRLHEEVDYYFIGYVLRSNSVRKKIKLLAQGISRYNISKSKVMDTSLLFPELEEQTKIGKFFQKIDKSIALEEQKLDDLKNAKKSFLQKMFI
ncbi:restriction endonuclease subunit S [Lactobacillus terrae]|uniref:restriction endonuclease subunit S n=1 Tax=Lactobacillus terrae TaxID=2269374 RepID=UPI000C1B7BD6|nr:restriction endonuclease subunit S [Lactobacillus terrae]